MQHTSLPLTLAFGPQGCMDEVKGRVVAAWCLAEQFGAFGGGRKCLHKVGAALQEIGKGTIQMPQGLLNGDRRDSCKPEILFLEIRQQSSKIIVGEALSMLKIGRLTGREAPIVDKADTPKRLSKDDSLLIGRVEPVLVRPPDLLAHGLFALSLFLEMLFHGRQDLSIERPIVLLSNLFHLFQQRDRKPDGKSFHVVFHATIVASSCNYIKRLGPLGPSPKQGTRLISP